MTIPLDAAHGYAELGWRVAPLRPEMKVPSINDWVEQATTDPDCIEGWWDTIRARQRRRVRRPREALGHLGLRCR